MIQPDEQVALYGRFKKGSETTGGIVAPSSPVRFFVHGEPVFH